MNLEILRLRTSILMLLVKNRSQPTDTRDSVWMLASHRPNRVSLNQSVCTFIIFPSGRLVPISAEVYTLLPWNLGFIWQKYTNQSLTSVGSNSGLSMTCGSASSEPHGTQKICHFGKWASTYYFNK